MPQNGFLGTDAPFLADLSLIAEIIFFIAICLGVVAQRRGRYKLHDWIQTPVVLLNLFLIIFVMVSSFLGQRVISTLPQRPGDAYYLVVAIHAALGLIAEGLAIYALLAGHKILPRKNRPSPLLDVGYVCLLDGRPHRRRRHLHHLVHATTWPRPHIQRTNQPTDCQTTRPTDDRTNHPGFPAKL